MYSLVETIDSDVPKSVVSSRCHDCAWHFQNPGWNHGGFLDSSFHQLCSLQVSRAGHSTRVCLFFCSFSCSDRIISVLEYLQVQNVV